MSATETHLCPHCGSTSNKYWHRLSPGLVGTLIKIRGAVGAKRVNSVHLQRDLAGRFELTKTEYNNAQKLRFHGLIAHDREAGRGYWLLTKRGRKFLDGEITLPASVQTLNNRVVAYDELYVGVTDVMDTKPTFDDYSFWHITKEPVALDMAQVELL
jgi:hypothetical protein